MDRCWPIDDVEEVLQVLSGRQIALLGGDVYRLVNGTFMPTHDSWHEEARPGEPAASFAERSVMAAKRYLSHYPRSQGQALWVGLVIDQ
jgi:hypothetical protein